MSAQRCDSNYPAQAAGVTILRNKRSKDSAGEKEMSEVIAKGAQTTTETVPTTKKAPGLTFR
ncbi:MAG: hypothetical protein ABSA29_16635, partial [Terriglobales bacterium]